MGNSPTTGHGGEEDRVQRDIAGLKSGERPTEEQSKPSIIYKSDSNETPVSNPLQYANLCFLATPLEAHSQNIVSANSKRLWHNQ